MRGRFDRRRPKRDNYMDDTTYKPTRPAEEEGAFNLGMSVKALRGLPKSTYSIAVDPYTASLPTANPYAILTAANRKIGGHYAGKDNLDGGNVSQYPNSNSSTMLYVADFIKTSINVNYRYLPSVYSESAYPPANNSSSSTPYEDLDANHTKKRYKPYIGYELVNQQRQSVAEATSVLQATTFTQMAINNYVVETDIPMGSAIVEKIDFNGGQGTADYHYIYRNINDVIYAASRFYQTFLQDCIGVVSWLNSFRLKQGTMIRSSWNRETPKLNGLFGLFNKKAFLSMVDSICLAFEGEYIDVDWIKQFNLLTAVPSRRSNSFMDPVLELQSKHVHPTVFRLYLVGADGKIIPTPVLDLANMKYKIDGTDEDIYTSIKFILDSLSAYEIMKWARTTEADFTTDNAYFNAVKARFDAVLHSLTYFKMQINDVREVFDVIARTRLNTWAKGFRPSITASTDAPLFHNLLIEDIFKTIYSGDSTLSFNDATKRWRFFSLWNMYNGIPEYDAKSGGAFLSLSSKVLDLSSDPDKTFAYLPIAYYPVTTAVIGGAQYAPICRAVTRNGFDLKIERGEVTVAADAALKRLAPLPSQSTEAMSVPAFYPNDAYYGSGDGNQDISATDMGIIESYIHHTLLEVFGVAAIKSVSSDATPVTTYTCTVDPDMLALYQVEVEDITNDALYYARATAVFRGSDENPDLLGFAHFGQQG